VVKKSQHSSYVNIYVDNTMITFIYALLLSNVLKINSSLCCVD